MALKIKELESKGVPTPKILVSDRVQILMPYHILLDTYEEARLAKNLIVLLVKYFFPLLLPHVNKQKHHIHKVLPSLYTLTVLDVLGYLKEIPMCVGYEIDGKVTKDFPTTVQLEKAKPVWNSHIPT